MMSHMHACRLSYTLADVSGVNTLILDVRNSSQLERVVDHLTQVHTPFVGGLRTYLVQEMWLMHHHDCRKTRPSIY